MLCLCETVTPGTDGVTPVASTASSAFATTTSSKYVDPKENDIDVDPSKPRKIYPTIVDVALCPEANDTDLNCSGIINTCDLDPECPKGHLCCFDGCALSCMPPVYVKASILPPDNNLVREGILLCHYL